MPNMGLKVGIYGGSGYGGIELIRLLSYPPGGWVRSRSPRAATRGRGISGVFPQLSARGRLRRAGGDRRRRRSTWRSSPTRTERAPRPSPGCSTPGPRLVIDLSADFRLPGGLYEEWYGEHPEPGSHRAGALWSAGAFRHAGGRASHSQPRLLSRRLQRLRSRSGRGERLGDKVRSVTVNALSGRERGRGKRPSGKTHFVSANENVSPYGFPQSPPRPRDTERARPGGSGAQR